MNEVCNTYDLNFLKIPKHVGIVMDGNGRWAIKRKLPRISGHVKGAERVKEITKIAAKIGIEALTLFAFSDENWRRPEEEVSGIMSLLRWYLRREKKDLIANNLRFKCIGDRQKLSTDIKKMIEKLECDTAANTGMYLCVALSYGARGEIIRAVKNIIGKVQAGEIFAGDIDEKIMEQCLDTHPLPPLDLYIRTSGEYRVSNFLLWQLAYTEMFFENVLWPDFGEEHFIRVLKQFENRERRFGLTSAQINNNLFELSAKA